MWNPETLPRVSGSIPVTRPPRRRHLLLVQWIIVRSTSSFCKLAINLLAAASSPIWLMRNTTAVTSQYWLVPGAQQGEAQSILYSG